MPQENTCKICNILFQVAYHQRSNQYCSLECLSKDNPGLAKGIVNSVRKRKELLGVPNGKNCIKCNKELTGYQKRFCSTLCNNKTNKKPHHGKQGHLNSKNKQNLLKQYIVDLAGGCCRICKYNKCLKSLVFHHLNPKNKSFSLDTTSLRKYTIEEILDELEKCICLCHNCHNELHDNITIYNGESIKINKENIDKTKFFSDKRGPKPNPQAKYKKYL